MATFLVLPPTVCPACVAVSAGSGPAAAVVSLASAVLWLGRLPRTCCLGLCAAPAGFGVGPCSGPTVARSPLVLATAAAVGSHRACLVGLGPGAVQSLGSCPLVGFAAVTSMAWSPSCPVLGPGSVEAACPLWCCGSAGAKCGRCLLRAPGVGWTVGYSCVAGCGC